MAPRNYSDADFTKNTAITHWVMAVGLAGAGIWVSSYLPRPWTFDINHPDFNPMIAMPGLFAAVTARELFRAIRWTVRQRRFGTATMELEGKGDVRLGARLAGVVRTATTLQPEGDVRVVLQCIETHQFREMKDEPQRTHRDEQFTVWKQEVRVPVEGLDSTRGIPFVFQLPKSVGPSPAIIPPASSPSGFKFEFKGAITIPGMRRIWTRNTAPSARTWELDISAPMPGTDFHAQFIVPVQQD